MADRRRPPRSLRATAQPAAEPVVACAASAGLGYCAAALADETAALAIKAAIISGTSSGVIWRWPGMMCTCDKAAARPWLFRTRVARISRCLLRGFSSSPGNPKGWCVLVVLDKKPPKAGACWLLEPAQRHLRQMVPIKRGSSPGIVGRIQETTRKSRRNYCHASARGAY
jgi:hypothetical protein